MTIYHMYDDIPSIPREVVRRIAETIDVACLRSHTVKWIVQMEFRTNDQIQSMFSKHHWIADLKVRYDTHDDVCTVWYTTGYGDPVEIFSRGRIPDQILPGKSMLHKVVVDHINRRLRSPDLVASYVVRCEEI